MINKKTVENKTNLFFLVITLLYPAVSLYITKADGAGRFVIFFALLTFLINFKYKSFWKNMFSPPVFYWGLWCVYSIVNTFYLGYFGSREPGMFVQNILVPYYVLLIIPVMKEKTEVILKTLVISLSVLTLFVLIFDTYLETFEGLRFGRIYGSNEFAIITNYGFIISLIALHQKAISSRFFWIIALLFLYGVVLAGSKKSLAISIVILIYALFKTKGMALSPVKKISMVVIGIICLVGVYFVLLKNSVGMDRLLNTVIASVNAGANENKFGDRDIFYKYGLEVFMEHPVNGIGLDNFRHVKDFTYVIHSEYMVQLAECGIIGFILYLLFNLSILTWFVKRWKRFKSERNILEPYLLGLISLYMISTAAWTYNFVIYFIFLGLCIRHMKRDIKTVSPKAMTLLQVPYDRNIKMK